VRPRCAAQILIANNGMAAAKCIMSIRRWAFLTLGDEQAIQFVAMARAPPLAPRGQPLRRAALRQSRCLAHAASARAAAESPGLCASAFARADACARPQRRRRRMI
jgi:hypothetical protein